MGKQTGFTLVELVTLIVILAILAVVALPRMNTSEYKTNEFRDKVVSALRYAQKSAVSHRRPVCVVFSAASITLSMDTDNNSACDTALLLPGTNSAIASSSDAGKAYFTSVPANFSFQPDGRSPGATIQLSGQPNILVVGETGHVN